MAESRHAHRRRELRGVVGLTLALVEYWVYENRRAHGHRTTLHVAACVHCNHGAGQRGGTRPDNGEWHGPFATLAAAEAKAAAIGGLARRSAVCVPGDRA
jgi:hypothetical protein